MALEALAALLLGGLVLWLVLQPLYGAGRGQPAFEEPDDPEETRRGIALIALKEIDFDRATGKLSETDYEYLKGKYTLEALSAIREEEGSPPRYCQLCGAALAPGSRFCASCGSRIAA